MVFYYLMSQLVMAMYYWPEVFWPVLFIVVVLTLVFLRSVGKMILSVIWMPFAMFTLLYLLEKYAYVWWFLGFSAKIIEVAIDLTVVAVIVVVIREQIKKGRDSR